MPYSYQSPSSAVGVAQSERSAQHGSGDESTQRSPTHFHPELSPCSSITAAEENNHPTMSVRWAGLCSYGDNLGQLKISVLASPCSSWGWKRATFNSETSTVIFTYFPKPEICTTFGLTNYSVGKQGRQIKKDHFLLPLPNSLFLPCFAKANSQTLYALENTFFLFVCFPTFNFYLQTVSSSNTLRRIKYLYS